MKDAGRIFSEEGVKQCLNENSMQALTVQPFNEACTNR